MDFKTNIKTEQREHIDARRKDGGDNFKKQDALKYKVNDSLITKGIRKPLHYANQGDVPVNKLSKIPRLINNLNKTDRITNDRNKKQNEPKLTIDASKVDTGADKMSIIKTSEMIATVNKTKAGDKKPSDKVIRPKFVYNNQGKDIKNPAKLDFKTDYSKNHVVSVELAPKGILCESNKSDNIKINSDEIKKEKDTTYQRKPMIKTVKSKNDDKVYKAVTFTEQKRINPTFLEINIPSIQAKKKAKLVDKILEAKPASLKATSNKSTSKLNAKNTTKYNHRYKLTERIKHKKLNRCISSPERFKKVDSPPTEVAKWAPSCLNAHTKPYYEAWVDTTLAAISKVSKKDKLFLDKQNIIKSFQKSLELGTESPDLIHEKCKDESYTGKIKINHKNFSKRTRQPTITPLLDVHK